MWNDFKMLLCTWLVDLILKVVPKNEEGNLLLKHLKAWVFEDLALISSKIFVNEKLRKKYGARLKR